MKIFTPKIFFLLGIFFLFPNAGNAQQASPPEIKALSRLSAHVRLDSLLKLSWKYIRKKPEISLKYEREAIRLAKLLREISKIAEAYNYMGVTYRNIGKYDSAYYYYKQALRFASLANDSTQIAYGYNNIGGYFTYKRQMFLALENIFKAIEIFEKRNNPRGLAYAKLQAGLAYAELGNYKEAEKFYKDVIEIRKKLHDRWGIFLAEFLLSNVYIKTGKLTEAEKILSKILEIAGENRNRILTAKIYDYYGQLEQQRKNYKKALFYYLKSLKMLGQYKRNFIRIVESECGAAYCYLKLGKIDKAMEMLNRADKLAREKNFLHGQITTLEIYLKIYSTLKEPKKLAYFAEKLIGLKDSLYKEETVLRNEEFKKLLDLHNLERQNAVLQTNIKNKRILIVLFIGLGILFFAFLVIVIIQNRKMKERSEQLQKVLEDKNKLFSIVAHDLKNPFASLLGYTDFLLNELEGDYSIEELKAGIKQIRTSAQKLLEMVENLLQWARAQTGKIKYSPKTYDISEIIMETVSYFTQSAKTKGVSLEPVFDDEDYTCYCDKDMLQTVLRNLISNAIKFSTRGDKIKIYAQKYPEKNRVYITVEDTGAGISKEKLKTLFSGAASSEGTSGEKGTGLGLLLVKEMTELNKGEIFVESELGVGSRFTISIPINPAN